jgi:hypothetical protein
MAADVITWARLRAPIGNGFSTAIGGPTYNNAEYANPQFVSASDQSPLRTYFNKFYTLATAPGYPVFDYSVLSGGYLGFGMRPIPYENIPADAVNELIGETVTLTTGTFVMDANAFYANGQNYGLSIGPITAIGKLTIV